MARKSMNRGKDRREEAPETPPAAMPPDSEPWGGRRRPAERPRHEHAEPEDPSDPAETSAAIEAESWGEVVEVCGGETVDGDFNGSPELAALEKTRNWDGADVLEGMQGREADALRENKSAEEVLAEAVAARRQVVLERLDEARELGLGELFEAALKGTEPEAGDSPVVRDDDVLRDQLALIDSAIEQLERRSAGGETE
jgi:hypothetical protein